MILVTALVVLGVFLIIRASVLKFVRQPEVRTLTSALRSADSIEEVYNATPLSVTHGESIYIPIVSGKISNFDNEEIVDAIRSLVKGLYSKSLSTSSMKLSDELTSLITEQELLSTTITVHDVGLAKFTKSGKFSKLIYQVSFKADKQYKVEVELLHSFDLDVDHMRCPNCGGALETNSDKCTYCESIITINSVFTWIISSVNNNKILK